MLTYVMLTYVMLTYVILTYVMLTYGLLVIRTLYCYAVLYCQCKVLMFYVTHLIPVNCLIIGNDQ